MALDSVWAFQGQTQPMLGREPLWHDSLSHRFGQGWNTPDSAALESHGALGDASRYRSHDKDRCLWPCGPRCVTGARDSVEDDLLGGLRGVKPMERATARIGCREGINLGLPVQDCTRPYDDPAPSSAGSYRLVGGRVNPNLTSLVRIAGRRRYSDER